MKRPLAFFGFTLFAVLLCLNLMGSTVLSVSLLAGAIILFAISLIIKNLRQSYILPTVLSAVITGCLLLLCFENCYEKTVDLSGENITVEGEIAESPYFSRENERYYCIIKVRRISGKKVNTKMRISFSQANDGIDHDTLIIGDKITFSATVYQMGNVDDTYKTYYKSQGIYLGAYSLKNLNIAESKYKPPGYYIDALRDKITENLLHDFDNDIAALLIALLTGDKTLMEDGIYESFKRSGVVHIMAVSGLHLSIWVSFLALFFDFKGKKGKIMAALMIVFTVFMLNFAYFTGSVKRAGMMTILLFMGKILGKEADSLNSLGFAAVCVLFVNPFAVSDISFMLSFLATLGILVLGVPLSERLMKYFADISDKLKMMISPLVSCFAISVSVTVFTLPVSLFYFGGVSLAAPITNLLFLFVCSPLILLTGFYSFLRFVPFVSAIAAVIIKYLALYMLKVTEYIGSFRLAYLHTELEELKYWLFFAFILLIAAFLFYNYNRFFTKVFLVVAAGIFVLSLGLNFYASLDRCKITVFNSDEGSCAVVSMNGRGVLIGFEGNSYSEKSLTEELENLNIKVGEAIFPTEIITSDQKSLCHSLGIENILTAEGTSVTVFEKVTLIKGERTVTVTAENTKTDIFYKDPLQEQYSYGIITNSYDSVYGEYNNSYAFTVGDKSPFAVIVRSENITVRGESSWLNLMKKVLKVT